MTIFSRVRFSKVQITGALKIASRLTFVFLWLMVPLSFVSYTSMGLGRDRLEGAEIVHDYFRLRWPGDGSFRIGGGSEAYRTVEEDVDIIDFAFRIFKPPVRRQPGSTWNRIGFWRFEDLCNHYPKVVWHRSQWFGVPSLLLPSLALIFVLWRRRITGSKER